MEASFVTLTNVTVTHIFTVPIYALVVLSLCMDTLAIPMFISVKLRFHLERGDEDCGGSACG